MSLSFDLMHLAPVAIDRVALAVVIGGSAVAAWLVPPDIRRFARTPPVRGLFDIALPTLLLSSFALLWLRTAALADVPVVDASRFVWRVITHSQFGTIWLWRLASVIALIALWLGYARRAATATAFVPMFLLGAVIALTISGTSHAGDEGLATLDNVVNTLHICAGASWGGAVIAYWVLLRGLSEQRMDAAIAVTATRLSLLATVALVAVLPSGLYNAWVHVPRLSDLWQSPYGNILLVKLLFVGVMLTIGALNRFRIIPGMLLAFSTGTSGGRPEALFMRVLAMDIAAFAVIMTGASALGLQGPPMH